MRRIFALILLILFIFVWVFGIYALVSQAAPAEKKSEMTWIEEEDMYGQMELLALLCYAEAGNQGLKGMRLVCDVVLNRVDDPDFPNTVEEVIYQEHQFSVMTNGAFEEAGWNITQEAFLASQLEWDRENRLDPNILYFNNGLSKGKDRWWYKNHCFGY